MFYLVPYGRSLLSSIAKFEDRALACGFAESAHKGNGDHYNVVEFKTVWTTKTLEQLTSVEGRATDLRSPESVIAQTPVEQKNAVEVPAPVETAITEKPFKKPFWVLSAPPQKRQRTLKETLDSFSDKPVPKGLRHISGHIALYKAAKILEVSEVTIKRLAKKKLIGAFTNGLNGRDRRYFIPVSDLRRLYKK
jgi:hypothetical protein